MSVLIIPVLGILLPIVIVPMALLAKFKTKQRELEHAERMRALDMGRTLPQDEPWTSPGKMAMALVAGVPTIAMGVAWMTTLQTGYHEDVWMACMAVSVTAIISGSVLAFKHFFGARQTTEHFYAKPHVDPETADFYANHV